MDINAKLDGFLVHPLDLFPKGNHTNNDNNKISMNTAKLDGFKIHPVDLFISHENNNNNYNLTTNNINNNKDDNNPLNTFPNQNNLGVEQTLNQNQIKNNIGLYEPQLKANNFTNNNNNISTINNYRTSTHIGDYKNYFSINTTPIDDYKSSYYNYQTTTSIPYDTHIRNIDYMKDDSINITNIITLPPVSFYNIDENKATINKILNNTKNLNNMNSLYQESNLNNNIKDIESYTYQDNTKPIINNVWYTNYLPNNTNNNNNYVTTITQNSIINNDFNYKNIPTSNNEITNNITYYIPETTTNNLLNQNTNLHTEQKINQNFVQNINYDTKYNNLNHNININPNLKTNKFNEFTFNEYPPRTKNSNDSEINNNINNLFLVNTTPIMNNDNVNYTNINQLNNINTIQNMPKPLPYDTASYEPEPLYNEYQTKANLDTIKSYFNSPVKVINSPQIKKNLRLYSLPKENYQNNSRIYVTPQKYLYSPIKRKVITPKASKVVLPNINTINYNNYISPIKNEKSLVINQVIPNEQKIIYQSPIKNQNQKLQTVLSNKIIPNIQTINYRSPINTPQQIVIDQNTLNLVRTKRIVKRKRNKPTPLIIQQNTTLVPYDNYTRVVRKIPVSTFNYTPVNSQKTNVILVPRKRKNISLNIPSTANNFQKINQTVIGSTYSPVNYNAVTYKNKINYTEPKDRVTNYGRNVYKVRGARNLKLNYIY